jgi:hypothetical protein
LTLILDAGALIAVERGDRDTVALLKRELEDGRVPATHGGVVGQVWRGGSGRQAPIARLLAATEVHPLDDELGRRVGVLLERAKENDVIDAAIVLIAQDGDTILTSDSRDLTTLAAQAGKQVDIVSV